MEAIKKIIELGLAKLDDQYPRLYETAQKTVGAVTAKILQGVGGKGKPEQAADADGSTLRISVDYKGPLQVVVFKPSEWDVYARKQDEIAAAELRAAKAAEAEAAVNEEAKAAEEVVEEEKKADIAKGVDDKVQGLF